METITVMDNKNSNVYFWDYIDVFGRIGCNICHIQTCVTRATNNLSDKFQGIMDCMIFLSCFIRCGFTFAALVYIFNFKKYYLVLCRAILMGL